jgi:hypothetical protein
MPSLSAARPVVGAALFLGVTVSACAAGHTADGGPAAAPAQPRSFVLYALSRGQGVPERARTTLARAEAALQELRDQGADVTITKQRIGLEGETKLCATFADQGLAAKALERLRQLVSGVDLVNLAEEPCGAGAPR